MVEKKKKLKNAYTTQVVVHYMNFSHPLITMIQGNISLHSFQPLPFLSNSHWRRYPSGAGVACWVRASAVMSWVFLEKWPWITGCCWSPWTRETGIKGGEHQHPLAVEQCLPVENQPFRTWEEFIALGCVKPKVHMKYFSMNQFSSPIYWKVTTLQLSMIFLLLINQFEN